MADNFKFKLESVLNLRSQKAKEAKSELQTIMKRRIEKEEDISAHKEKLQQHFNSKDRKKKLEEIQAFYHHKEYLEDEIERLNRERENLLDIESLKRNKFSEAMKEEKIMENLKEKKKEEHIAEQNRKEQNELDEVGIRIYSKQNKSYE